MAPPALPTFSVDGRPPYGSLADPRFLQALQEVEDRMRGGGTNPSPSFAELLQQQARDAAAAGVGKQFSAAAAAAAAAAEAAAAAAAGGPGGGARGRGARRRRSIGRRVAPFPVISRLVGGAWTNTHHVFRGLAFEAHEVKQRVARWKVDGDCCQVRLESGADTAVTLNGRHVGGGVVDFDLEGAPYEYKFHQVGSDTTASPRAGRRRTARRRGRRGTIVLTGDDACVQTIVNLAAGALEKIEVIRGTRSRGQVRILP